MVNALRLLTAEAEGYIPSENINLMWSTVVTGLVVVFLILILLVIILWGLGKVINIKIKPKKSDIKPAEPVPAGTAAAAPAAAAETIEEYDEEDDGEIIAVIAAAISAYGEAEGKQYRIASVKKKEKALRSNWANAGIAENTRPF